MRIITDADGETSPKRPGWASSERRDEMPSLGNGVD